jgi:hypothetical protein
LQEKCDEQLKEYGLLRAKYFQLQSEFTDKENTFNRMSLSWQQTQKLKAEELATAKDRVCAVRCCAVRCRVLIVRLFV